ncbi:hypothetical protein BaRGS_00034081 [Batillaria attramentaria]|uniref:Uncharacterized protein n=1 Tax=Batillaria attramentaria TaxID=370345 RepID=A0ABD0JI80_9CAEN
MAPRHSAASLMVSVRSQQQLRTWKEQLSSFLRGTQGIQMDESSLCNAQATFEVIKDKILVDHTIHTLLVTQKT